MTKIRLIGTTDKYGESFYVDGERIDHVAMAIDNGVVTIAGIKHEWKYLYSIWHDRAVPKHTVAGQDLYNRIYKFNTEEITEVDVVEWSWRRMRKVTKTFLGIKLDQWLKTKEGEPFHLESNTWEILQ